jgi:DNA-binding transcriptional LysR family regulator
MQQPELRLVRYWIAVAEEGNITRAAERLHLSQPALSTAVKQLEQQLGVALLDRSDRVLRVTPAGEVLLREGRALLAAADRAFEAVRERDGALTARLRIGVSPTARHGLGPELLRACGERVPGVMIYPQEDTTGALVRDVRAGRLDLAVLFCSGEGEVVRHEPAVVHVRDDHPLAGRPAVGLDELAGETLLVAESAESGGFTETVLGFFAGAGLAPPRVRPDPYPDLGLQAVREGLGVVLYVRSAFPPQLRGSAFVPVKPEVGFPFSLLWRSGPRSAALDAVLEVARGLG